MNPVFLRAKILTLIVLLFSITSNAQNLINSRQTSFYTYIYKITDKQAEKIYQKDILEVDKSFFHTLVDSFPTDKAYQRKLKQGHYLKTFAERNKQRIAITTIQNFEVFIFNNDTDLCIQVIDLKGNVINNAKVVVRNKQLRFNKKIQCYFQKKANQKGFLKVTYKGFTAYYNLSRDYNNSCIKRGTRKVLYGTPVKYIWLPVKFAVSLPIDGFKSIKHGWAQGTIYQTKRFFKKITSLFDKDENNYYKSNKFRNKHTGYMVFNKPKYLPGDTVKFKAFIVTKKGKPVNKKVNVVLEGYQKKIKLKELTPYRAGGYKYEFYLHDSLQLDLDRRYNIYLNLDNDKEYISRSFKYEDYELAKNKLTLRVYDNEQFRNKAITLNIKGTDENDLNLMDARVEVLLTPKTTDKYFANHIFIPDTLLFLKKNLRPTGETKIQLSDSTFPKVNFKYNINVKLLTSDNETISKEEEISYFYESEMFKAEVETDSIAFEYLKNGVKTSKQVTVNSMDKFGNKTLVYKGTTPCKVPIEPYFAKYIIEADSISETVYMSSESSMIQCLSERTRDSVSIVVNNPRKIPFVYNIYKKNRKKSYGYTDTLNIKQKSRTKQNYFVAINYLWGGRVETENYKIPFIDKKLNVTVTQPRIVYPGQKAKIAIVVTDVDGKPVEGVDLTAFSMTKKFDYSAPTLPYLGKSRKDRNIINSFNFRNFYLNKNNGLNLDYDAWRILAGIDSIEYYKFSYPKKSIYKAEYNNNDSITQFAPFVFADGEMMPIHVIYVDNKPVYFSWSTNIRPYSFKVDSGYHQIKLRTTNRNITIDSMYFKKGKKLIFSLNQNKPHKNITIHQAENKLSDYEKHDLYRYIIPYRNNFKGRYAYLEQDSNIYLLNPKLKYQNNNLAGPFVGKLNFHLQDSISTTFTHEPFFEYEFLPSLLKMRSIKSDKYPPKLKHYKANSSLSDVVFTKNMLDKQWKEYLENSRYLIARYKYPHFTKEGTGKLLFKFKEDTKPTKELPLNVLVFRYDNHQFLRVYPGSISTIHQLQPGYHKLIFFYSGAKYHVEDSIAIKPNGVNYYQFKRPTTFKKDTFGLKVSNIIEETIFKPSPYYQDEEKELKRIFNLYQQTFKYTGDGSVISGHVYSEEDGLPLPGVAVVVKGTTFGTTTDIEGCYSIKVPSRNNILNFSFIGCQSKDIQIGYNHTIDVTLSNSVNNLEEVVVVAYGSAKKTAFTGSVAAKSAGNISKGILSVSGNISKSLEGKVAGIAVDKESGATTIRIRGCASINFDKEPLYIIDGNIYTGNISDLDPKIIKNTSILKGAEATAMYGVRGANGVIVIETKTGEFKSEQQGTEFDDTFLKAVSQAKSIRDNFSDYAFWQPNLVTDKEGKASFETVFPDDVTSWKTFYLAMNGNKQSGQTSGLIKSYKPLMAQLTIPRFLVQGDTTYAIGKVLNYTADSIEVKRKFEIDSIEKLSGSKFCNKSLIDTLPVVASTDSLQLKYQIETKDSYFDGEKRTIPVHKKGLEKTKGKFYVLDRDTTIQMQFDTTLEAVNLYARADILDVIEDEINYLIRYKYLCNEQIASKLKALLAAKTIAEYKGEEFKQNKKVKKLIRLLNKRQKKNHLWGWWKDSEESLWISLHVLEALIQAEQMEYKTALNKSDITEFLIWEIENTKDFNQKIRILKILHLLGATANFKSYIYDLEQTKEISLNGLLHIINLKQRYNMKYSLDALAPYKKTTLFGNVYYSDENKAANLLTSDIQNTLLVYKILKTDSKEHAKELDKIRNYLLEKRSNGYWQNTYESAQIIETILPDLLKSKTKLSKPKLTLTGDINKTVSKFPFEMQVKPQQKIKVSKTGDFPVYFTTYQKYWDNTPDLKQGDFEITTSFDNKPTTTLTAGKKVKLIAKITVKKDAEYVMINIPIPGGCSYADKNSYHRNESHREYFKNETTIFCSYLHKGEYTFEVDLLPRYSGTYTVNPAKIELMYFPTFNANNKLKTVKVK